MADNATEEALELPDSAADDAVVEDLTGLKSALQKERDARKEADRKYRETVSKYKDIDPVKAKEALDKIKEIEDKALADAGEFETLKTRVLNEKETEVTNVKTEFTTKLQKAESKLHSVMIDRELEAEYAAQGGKPKSIKQFSELARKNVELESSEDDFTVVIKNGLGSDIKELVTKLKDTDEFGIFFDADLATGSGSSSQSRTGGSSANLVKSKMTDAEKARYIREHTYAEYKKLPEK